MHILKKKLYKKFFFSSMPLQELTNFLNQSQVRTKEQRTITILKSRIHFSLF